MTSPTNLFRNPFTAAIMHHSHSRQLAEKSSTWHGPAGLHVTLWRQIFSVAFMSYCETIVFLVPRVTPSV